MPTSIEIPVATMGFLWLQVTFPPPYVGYDHNWALFGLGWDAASKAHLGAISNEYAPCHLASPPSAVLPKRPFPHELSF